MVPQPFDTEGNRSYPEFWPISDDPRYLGYFTPTDSKIQNFGM
jgi:hypothetical protein